MRERLPFLLVVVPLAIFVCLALVDGISQLGAQEPTTRVVDLSSDRAETTFERTGLFYSGSIIASDPMVLRSGDGLRMYYTDLDTSTSRTVIAATASEDGNVWTAVDRKGAVWGQVLAGRTGSWAENVESSSVVRVGNKFHLYFSGYRDDGNPAKGFPAALGMVTSSDGVNFPSVPEAPILEPSPGWYDNDAIYSPTILHEDDTFYMIYVGHAYSDLSRIPRGGVYLLGATSRDGISWTKRQEPIARPGQFSGWRVDGLAEPYLLKTSSNEYLLFYTGLAGEERAIGVGIGASPLGPFRFSATPVLTPGGSGMPDEHQVLAPAALLEDGKIVLWYLAANDAERLSIGQAQAGLEDVRAIARR